MSSNVVYLVQSAVKLPVLKWFQKGLSKSEEIRFALVGYQSDFCYGRSKLEQIGSNCEWEMLFKGTLCDILDFTIVSTKLALYGFGCEPKLLKLLIWLPLVCISMVTFGRHTH